MVPSYDIGILISRCCLLGQRHLAKKLNRKAVVIHVLAPPALCRWSTGLATMYGHLEPSEPTGPVPVVNRFDN